LEAPYDFELDRIIREISLSKAGRVLLQMPDGLKPYAQALTAEISRRTRVEVYVSAGSCYGGCDLALKEAERLKVDLLVHFGHTAFLPSPSKPRVVYVEARCKFKVGEAVRAALPMLSSYRKIGLTASLQHVHRLGEARKILEAEGKQVEVGSPEGPGVAYPGQILGCNVSAAESLSSRVEAYLHLGGGVFHGLGVYLATGKPVIAADPHSGKATEVSEAGEKAKRKLKASLLRLGEAYHVGVIIGMKPVQFNLQLALKVARKLRKLGKHPTLLSLDEIDGLKLEGFPDIEAFVCTACPRLGLDDAERFSKPLVPAFKFLEVFGG
jgi:2-(3-amino-3-carboxypropyl)histidine synthase